VSVSQSVSVSVSQSVSQSVSEFWDPLRYLRNGWR